MKKMMLWAAAFAAILLFTGCSKSPETLKKDAVEFVTAQNLMEMVVGKQLSGASYMPGLEQAARNDFTNTCRKAGVPMETPFEELLKNGDFDEVKTDVIMKTLQESNNPVTADTTVFKVTFRAVKRMDGNELVYNMIFVVCTTPEGPGILDSACSLEFNGKEEELSTDSMLIILGDAGKKGNLTKSVIQRNAAREAAAKKKAESPQN